MRLKILDAIVLVISFLIIWCLSTMLIDLWFIDSIVAKVFMIPIAIVDVVFVMLVSIIISYLFANALRSYRGRKQTNRP